MTKTTRPSIDFQENGSYHSPMGNLWIDRAKTRMQELGLSHAALAEKMRCTRACVSHYFSGFRTPALNVFSEMAQALECTPAWLQFGEGTLSSLNTAKEKKLRGTSKILSNAISLYSWKDGTEYLKKLLASKNVAGNTRKKKEEKKTKKTEKIKETQRYLPYFRKDPNQECIAIIISEKALTPAKRKYFKKNDIILVNMKHQPKMNQWVVAQSQRTQKVFLQKFLGEYDIVVLGAVVSLMRTHLE